MSGLNGRNYVKLFKSIEVFVRHMLNMFETHSSIPDTDFLFDMFYKVESFTDGFIPYCMNNKLKT